MLPSILHSASYIFNMMVNCVIISCFTMIHLDYAISYCIKLCIASKVLFIVLYTLYVPTVYYISQSTISYSWFRTKLYRIISYIIYSMMLVIMELKISYTKL